MKLTIKGLIVTTIISIAIGSAGTAVIAGSENGYVAGFIVLPILILTAVLSLILFIIGLVVIKKQIGRYLLLASILIPTFLIGSALLAKEFQIGAYREEPMMSWPAESTNIVIFKTGTANEQINSFIDEVISNQGDRGSWPLPGIRDIGRLEQKDGHEVLEFGFFESATDKQKEFVYSRVISSPIVTQLLKNVPTKDFINKDVPAPDDNRPTRSIKVAQP
jgi:hypothetical protein